MLLLLDNFEHLLDAAAQLSELLAFAPGLKVLVTSRAVLHLVGEHEYNVPPLALPDKVAPADLTALVQCESVQLLLERAQARGANLSLAPDNAVAVANICLRLEGLPLALELAAARCKVFAPAELLAHLDHRLAFLTSGARDQPRRQQTLRATLDWSYQLLTADQQTLFARLGVFVGGFTLEAAEFVCTEAGAAHLQVVDGLAALLDQSLLRQMDETAGERRFLMLETIREYAREQLAVRGEEAMLCDRHAAYFLELAEKSQPLLFGVQQQMWLQRLTLEISNFRAAVHWWRANGDYGQVARLGAVLCWLWIKHGNLREGAEWTEWALAEMKRGNAVLPNAIRANALHAAAVSADWLGDLAHARALYEEYLQVEQAPDTFFDYYDVLDSFASNLIYAGDLQRALTLHERALAWAQQYADSMGIPNSLAEIGSLLHLQGDYERAKAVLQNALALRKAAGASMGIASAQGKLAIVLLEYGEVAQAQRLLEEALELVTALHDQQLLGNLLSTLGVVAQLQYEYQKAYQYQHAAVVLFEQLGFQVYHALALVRLGNLMLFQAESDSALTYYLESLALAQKIGYQIGNLLVLEGLAGVATLRGQATAAAQMLGAAHAYRQKIGLVPSVDERSLSERTLAVVRDLLDEAQFDVEFITGQAIALHDAVNGAH